MGKLLLSIIGFVFVPVFASAAEPLTLDEATRIAIDKSPVLDQSRASAEYAKWKKTEALSGFLPSLTAGGHWFFLERNPVFRASFGTFEVLSAPPVPPWVDAEIGFKLPLFNGLRNVDEYQSASLAGRAAELSLDWADFALRQQIRLAYYGVLEAERLAEVAAQDVQDLRDHRELVQNQLRAGVTTHVSLLRVDTQLSNAVSEKTNADDEVQIRRQQLAQLLGEEREDRPLVGDLPVPGDDVLHAIDAAVLGSREDLEALGLQSEAGEKTHSSAAKWWVPSVNFAANYVGLKNINTEISSYAVGLQASWTLFDGLKSYSQSKEALETQRIADRQHENAKLQAQTDFETYRRRYRYNLEKYRARSEDVTRSTESVRLARSGYKAGTQTTTDVLDAEQDLFNARANEIQAQYGALDALVRFELSVGRRLANGW